MGGKSGPPAPDYAGAAQAQAKASEKVTTEQTWANRPNQTTPWGSSTWTAGKGIDPSTGQTVTTWNENLTLTPAEQQALESQQGVQQGRSDLANQILGRLGEEIGPQMDWSQYGDPTKLDSTSAQARQGAIDNAMQQFSSRADPQWERGEDALRTRLANQGVTEGSESYRRAMEEFQQNKGDAYKQAQFSAIQQGGAEGQRAQGMDIASADYANKIRSQQISEEMQKRGFSLNEINALLTGAQVQQPNMPSFGQAGAAQGTQNLQAASMTGQGMLDQYNAGQAQTGQLIGAGSTAVMAAVVL